MKINKQVRLAANINILVVDRQKLLQSRRYIYSF